MAKMFYTLDEVAAKLGKTEDEVKEMAASGQLQEFRDRDKLMFKVEQIDLLAGSDEDTGDVHLDLDASGSASGLDLEEDSVLGLTDSREGTGISVFDTDHGEDSAAGTGTGTGSAIGTGSGALGMVDSDLGDFGGDDELNLEAVGSGSGLLDLTRESDDTSLGAELLEEVYSSDDNIEMPANASGLFEAAGTESAAEELAAVSSSSPVGEAVMPMMLEAYDGPNSGLGAGLLLGALVSLVCVAIIIILALSGVTPGLAVMFSGQLMMYAGGLLGVTIVLGLVGLFIGKASG